MKIHAKQRMQTVQPAIGTVLWSGSVLAASVLSGSGLDFLIVDNQHGDWDDERSMAAFRSITHGSAIPMARVRQNDYYAIGRLLDRGAAGIMVPMVNTVAEAQAAANAMRYPPLGDRSIGAVLADFYGPDYMAWIDDEVFLAVQIETPQAAANAGNILAVEGVDGCWVGPVDLARTMGVDLGTPEGVAAHEASILSILDACLRAGKIPGIHCLDLADARRWLSHGFQFVTIGSETDLLLQGAAGLLSGLER